MNVLANPLMETLSVDFLLIFVDKALLPAVRGEIPLNMDGHQGI